MAACDILTVPKMGIRVLMLALEGSKVWRLLAAAYLFSFIYIQVLGCIGWKQNCCCQVGSAGVCARTLSPIGQDPGSLNG
jgi:hypothetical protein